LPSTAPRSDLLRRLDDDRIARCDPNRENHSGTIAGKLSVEMIPTGPSGWRIEATSTLVDAFSVIEPVSRCGIPHANSTTSWPRATSPAAASESTFRARR
jgi:hypothetical protein